MGRRGRKSGIEIEKSLDEIRSLLFRGKNWSKGTNYSFLDALRATTFVVQSWAVPLPLKFIRDFNSWLESGGLRKNYWLVHYYVKRIEPYREELGFMKPGHRDSAILSAGLFCFIGQLMLYWCQFGLWDTAKDRNPGVKIFGEKFLDVAFCFSMLYIYVDYFLDRVPTSEEGAEKKKEIFAQMMSLLHDPTSGDPPEGMTGLVKCYKFILEASPESKPTLIKLFMTELEGVAAQKNPNLSREQYMDIALRKGGMTGAAIQAILGCDPHNGAYHIAELLQLIDDMIDVYEDIEDGTNTIATHDLKVYGNMDTLFMYAAIGVYKIPSTYVVFRFVLMEALCYTLGQGGRFSRSLVRRHKKSIHLNWGFGNRAMEALDSWLQDLVKGYDKNLGHALHVV